MSRFNELQIEKMAEHEARQVISNPCAYSPSEKMIALHTASSLNDAEWGTLYNSSMEMNNIELYKYGEY